MPTLIWRRGVRGPSPALVPEKFLDEYDRSRKLLSYPVVPEHADLPLDKLVVLYPPPKENADGTPAPDHA